MRQWQLEYGAEIGRAVVNFDGPIVFCVVSRYHGGAFVVFSQRLNDELEAVGARGLARVGDRRRPGGRGRVRARGRHAAAADPRIVELDERIEAAEGAERAPLRERARRRCGTRCAREKLGELAAEFDRVHSVERALAMGSVSRIIPPASLRPYLIDAVERGMRRAAGADRRRRWPRPGG